MIGLIYRDKNEDETIGIDQYEHADRACQAAIAKAESR
jgi:hypothetical protein